ncbi:hypothetical protein LINPERHAP2_LOCUS7563 [Linum perenne]
MRRKIPQHWAKQGGVEVFDIGWGFYVVRFETIADQERAMFGGPWMVGVWSSKNKIGKTIRIDHTTLQGNRGNFARIYVEVDLSKPLLSKYHLRRRVRHIEYEGLHTIGFSCGCYGHQQDKCTVTKTDEAEEADVSSFDNPIFCQDVGSEVRPEVTEEFGPWMMVKRGRRRGSQVKKDSLAPGRGGSLPEQVRNGNRFGVFNVESDKESGEGFSPTHEKEAIPILIQQLADEVKENQDPNHRSDNGQKGPTSSKASGMSSTAGPEISVGVGKVGPTPSSTERGPNSSLSKDVVKAQPPDFLAKSKQIAKEGGRKAELGTPGQHSSTVRKKSTKGESKTSYDGVKSKGQSLRGQGKSSSAIPLQTADMEVDVNQIGDGSAPRELSSSMELI